MKAAASSVIRSHKHPSGQLKPSIADLALTKKIVSAGEFIDIAVLDPRSLQRTDLTLTNEGFL